MFVFVNELNNYMNSMRYMYGINMLCSFMQQ